MRIPVTVGNDDSTPFTRIEEGFSFPAAVAGARSIATLSISASIPIGAAAEDQRLRPEPKIKPKPKPKLNPSAPTG